MSITSNVLTEMHINLAENLPAFDLDNKPRRNIIARYRLNYGGGVRKYFKIDRLYLYKGSEQLIIRPRRLFRNDVITIR